MKFFGVILLLLAGIYLTACSTNENRTDQWQRWKENNGNIKVLTTIAMITDLVNAIGNGYVDTLTLIKGDLDPHSYQLVKGDDEKLAAADIVFYNGLGLEHGPSLQYQLSHHPKAISLGDMIHKKLPDKILYFKNQLDPHIWMDISLWAENIPFIVNALSTSKPEHAKEFKANGDKLIQQLQEAHEAVHQLMQSIPEDHRYLVTSHDAFNYFTRAYLATEFEQRNGGWQARFAAPEGLAPESQLSATDIQQIIEHLAKYGVHVVFPESNVSKDSIRKIVQASKERGLVVQMADVYLYADAMGKPGSDGDSYIKMIQHNAKIISQFLAQEKNHDATKK